MNTNDIIIEIDKLYPQLDHIKEMVNALNPPTTAFAYEPRSAIVKWDDKNGGHSGNLDAFNQQADFGSVVKINLANQMLSKLSLGSNLPKLRIALCYNCGLSELDVTGAMSLEVLQCQDNSLKALNLSNNSALATLDAAVNRLTQLDVSRNPKLRFLNAYNMAVPEINTDNNPALFHVDLGGNPMSSGAVDRLLTNLDRFGLVGGDAALYATAIPTVKDVIKRLEDKKWGLQLDA